MYNISIIEIFKKEYSLLLLTCICKYYLQNYIYSIQVYEVKLYLFQKLENSYFNNLSLNSIFISNLKKSKVKISKTFQNDDFRIAIVGVSESSILLLFHVTEYQ